MGAKSPLMFTVASIETSSRGWELNSITVKAHSYLKRGFAFSAVLDHGSMTPQKLLLLLSPSCQGWILSFVDDF